MADPRYSARYSSGAGRRSPPLYNPARASLPLSVGYNNHFSGDIHVMPISATQRYSSTAPRAYPISTATSINAGGAPTTTRTYVVPKETPARASSVRDAGRSRRSSTLDSTAARPVIVTTTTSGRAHGTTSHTTVGRSSSPIRDDYRASDSQFYAQPASSIRSRTGHHGPYSAALDDGEFAHLRERSGTDYLPPRGDYYRRERAPVYNNSRTPAGPVEYEYEYTKPSDLARWDLDHDKPSHRRRRESMDRYYRPSVSYTAEQPAPRETTDVARSYNASGGRPYDSRPPPTTWGLDKIKRSGAATTPATYEMPIPPAAPAPPPVDPSRRPPELQVPAGTSERRTAGRRPVSLYQEGQPRSAHHDDFYRTREDERLQRDRRDRDQYDPSYPPAYVDDGIVNRGFGIRTDSMKAEYGDDPIEAIDGRRATQDPRRRSDEDLRKPAAVRDDDAERAERRRRNRDGVPVEEDKERRGSKEKDEDESDRKRFRDKVQSGLGIAASAIGLGGVVKSKDAEAEKDDKGSPRRRRAEDDRRRNSDEVEPSNSRAAERYTPREALPDTADAKTRRRSPPEEETRAARRREAEAALEGAPAPSGRDDSPQSEDGKSRSRRRRSSNAFDPTDPHELRNLRDELAAMRVGDGATRSDKPTIIEPTADGPPARGSPDPKESSSALVRTKERDDRDRGRSLGPPEREERQVRVVSPPRAMDDKEENGKEEKKPLRGILKQPSAKFPEEPNPIREGVAPHKDDKKAKEVPAGARWTKINRKIVNPEALTLGKERFEERDDFVIVLRVLSKEEIQAYADATAVLRDRRRQRIEDDEDRDGERDDNDRRRSRRHRKDRDDDGDDDGEREERLMIEPDYEKEYERSDRRRRHRRDDEVVVEDDDPRARHEYHHHHHHHRSHRDRDRDGE